MRDREEGVVTKYTDLGSGRERDKEEGEIR